MAEAAIAEHVHHHVLQEALAELGRDARAMDDGLGVVTVHVEDGGFHHLRDVGGVRRGPRVMRRGREADLVVDDDMDRAAGAVAARARHRKAFRHDTLAGEGRIAVHQHGDHHRAAGLHIAIAELDLLGAGLTEHDGVHRFQMRGVRGEREVDLVAVERAVG